MLGLCCQAENLDELSFGAYERIVILERDDKYNDGWYQVSQLSLSFPSQVQLLMAHSHRDATLPARSASSRNPTPPPTPHQTPALDLPPPISPPALRNPS